MLKNKEEIKKAIKKIRDLRGKDTTIEEIVEFFVPMMKIQLLAMFKEIDENDK